MSKYWFLISSVIAAHRKCWIALLLAFAFLEYTSAAESDVSGGSIQGAPLEESTGISLFSRTPLHLTLIVDGGYDTNTGTTNQQNQGSAFTQGQAIVGGVFGTERANTTLNSSIQLIYFTESSTGTNPEVNFAGSIAGFYSVSRRLQLTGHLSAAYGVEPDFSANIGPQQRVGYFFTSADDVSAAFQWSDRLSAVTTDNFLVVHYDDSAIGFNQDRIEDTIGEQVRWSISRATLVGEYRFQIVNYNQSMLSSNSHYVLGGIDYAFNERVTITTRGGATFRFFDDGTERTEPRAEGTLKYSIGRKSSIAGNVSYGLEEPDIANFTSRTTFRAGLQLNYWLTAHILSTLNSYYTDSRNSSSNAATASSSPNEKSYSVTLGLEYALTHRWGVHANFDYSGLKSDIPGNNYTRERYSAGLVVNF